MARRILAIHLLVLALIPLAAGTPPAAGADEPEYESDQVICSLRPGYSIDELNQRWGTSLMDYSIPGLYLLDIPDGDDPATFDEELESDPACAWAEPNYIWQTAEAVRQMVISATGLTYEDYVDQAIFDRIGLDAAHGVTGGAGVLVAVLDTGVDLEHELFQGRLSSEGYDFVDYDYYPADTANGIDDDGDGQVDEGYGHGTMVAGIIAAVAPDATILPVRVLDDEGRGDIYRIALAIDYARAMGARVINMSFGLPQHVDAIARVIAAADSAGVVMVAGAGNENREEPAYYPAVDIHCAMVVAVDSLDVKAPFSDYNHAADVAAPGVAVRSAYPGGEWASGSGCSFAAPLVSGEAALVRAFNPAAGPDQVLKTLRDAVVPIYDIPGNDKYRGLLGEGRVFLPFALGATTTIAGRTGGPAPALAVTPNPACETVVFHLAAPAAGGADAAADVGIYDVHGREVRRLAGVAGADIAWDGHDGAGRPVPSGVYFARLTGDGPPATAGFALVR